MKPTKGTFITAGLLIALFVALPNKQTPAPQLNNSETVVTTQPTESAKQPPSNASEHLAKPVEPEIKAVESESRNAANPQNVQPQVKPAVQSIQVTGCENYRSLINQYDWNHEIALAIMRAESGCNPSATNTANTDGSTDRGLFQVNSIHRQKVTSLIDLYDPATNISVAYRIYQGQGWQAWSVYNSGKYLRYL